MCNMNYNIVSFHFTCNLFHTNRGGQGPLVIHVTRVPVKGARVPDGTQD